MTDVRTTSELTEATATGLRWTTTIRVLTELLLLASMIVLARLIPPSAFGMFAVAVIVQELAVNVPSEGVGSASVLVERRVVFNADVSVDRSAGRVYKLARLAHLMLTRPAQNFFSDDGTDSHLPPTACRAGKILSHVSRVNVLHFFTKD